MLTETQGHEWVHPLPKRCWKSLPWMTIVKNREEVFWSTGRHHDAASPSRRPLDEPGITRQSLLFEEAASRESWRASLPNGPAVGRIRLILDPLSALHLPPPCGLSSCPPPPTSHSARSMWRSRRVSGLRSFFRPGGSGSRGSGG